MKCRQCSNEIKGNFGTLCQDCWIENQPLIMVNIGETDSQRLWRHEKDRILKKPEILYEGQMNEILS